jgi:hypothetical protein
MCYLVLCEVSLLASRLGRAYFMGFIGSCMSMCSCDYGAWALVVRLEAFGRKITTYILMGLSRVGICRSS